MEDDIFEVKVGVHLGAVISTLLLIMVLEAPSVEFRRGIPWNLSLLYADDFLLVDGRGL